MYTYQYAFSSAVAELWDDIDMKAILASFITLFITLFMAIQSLAHILLTLLVVSFILESWVALRTKQFNIAILQHAIAKLVMYALATLVVGLASRAISITIKMESAIDVWFICLVCVNEAIVCLNSLSILGFPVPKAILKRLKTFVSDADKK